MSADGRLLQAVELGKIYRTPSGAIDALDGFSYTFGAGRITAIMGPSGSGKTTLLNLLAGLDTPTGGEVRLGDQSLGGLNERQRAELRRSSFGIVFQSFNLVSVLSARQNVALPMALASVPAARRSERANELLERFGLTNRAGQLPYRLSGGERQRVALARALANDPQVLFADEPTGNLDSKSGAVVLDALREVASEGRTVVVVTHDAELAGHTDVILTLRDGRLQDRETVPGRQTGGGRPPASLGATDATRTSGVSERGRDR